jgi:hypothetical protein
VARRVLKQYRPHEGYWPREYIPAKREAAWQHYEDTKFKDDPELKQVAENYKKYFAGRRG